MIKSVNKVCPSGTCLQGYITIPYSKLVKKLGNPEEGDGYKVDAEWVIELEDNSVVTIYNWKNGENYCGSGGLPVSRITKWNVGGVSSEVLNKLQAVLGAEVSSAYSANMASFFSV
jgi:hypothetical protein